MSRLRSGQNIEFLVRLSINQKIQAYNHGMGIVLSNGAKISVTHKILTEHLIYAQSDQKFDVLSISYESYLTFLLRRRLLRPFRGYKLECSDLCLVGPKI